MRIVRHPWAGDAEALAGRLRGAAPDPALIAGAVAQLVEEVRRGGDPALLDLVERFDGVRPASLRVADGHVQAAPGALEPELREALEATAASVRAVAEAQLHPPARPPLPDGQRVTVDEVPVRAAAIYAPAGRAAYPSSVLMGAVPARVAGVERVVVASPPETDGLPAPAVLAAAAIAGADEVYAAGGAQAIAALAHGTESIAPVDVIAGPGSPWVQEAKLQCSRVVGIDGYAGPSELVVIADAGAVPEWLALDLCAQAEHGDNGLLVAIGTDAEALAEIGAAAERIGDERPTVRDAELALVEAPALEQALALAEAIAPQHLQHDCAGAADLAAQVRTAGCVFAGPRSATAFGDYAAGSNHVLPTGGAGRFSGPLGPRTFRRSISRVEVDEAAAAALAPRVDAIARAEGFPVHGVSAMARRSGPPERAS